MNEIASIVLGVLWGPRRLHLHEMKMTIVFHRTNWKPVS